MTRNQTVTVSFILNTDRVLRAETKLTQMSYNLSRMQNPQSWQKDPLGLGRYLPNPKWWGWMAMELASVSYNRYAVYRTRRLEIVSNLLRRVGHALLRN